MFQEEKKQGKTRKRERVVQRYTTRTPRPRGPADIHKHIQRQEFFRCTKGLESDYMLRCAASMPSIDCILSRKRLWYLHRLLERGPKALIAMLQNNFSGKKMPWTLMIREDLKRIYELRGPPAGGCNFGHPLDPSKWSEWHTFIKEQPFQWHQYVDSLFYCESIADKNENQASQTAVVKTFVCDECPEKPCFGTQKALDQHARKKHGKRNPMRFFADPSGTCPICGTKFLQRFRLLAHLSDRRRTRCRDRILERPDLYPPIDANLVAGWDAEEAILRKRSLREGHTHPIASGHAKKADGKRVGHVTR